VGEAGDDGGGTSAAISIRPALESDRTRLEQLIVASARALSRGYYTDAETEAAITHVFGVDTDLVTDGSYMVVLDGAAIVGCGGWSRRKTLFGGDRYAARTPGWLDPAIDAARIRAFFIAPSHARRGVGALLLAACETAAAAAGFGRTALMSTLPGVPFYARHGYVAATATDLDLGGIAVKFVPMTKELLPKRYRTLAFV